MSMFGKREKDWIEVAANRLVKGHTIRFSRSSEWVRVTEVKKLNSGLYQIAAGGQVFTDIKPWRKFDVKAAVR